MMTYEPSPPSVLSTSEYSRSKSNLDQVYYNHLTKQDRENILPDTDKIQKVQKVQKMGLQRQSSCKEVPEKISKNNSIRHSVSEANINRSTASSRMSSRKNSFSKVSALSGAQNLSKIPQTPFRAVDRTLPVKTVPLYSSTPIVDIYVSPKCSPETPPEEEFVPAMADEAYGLNINEFLPVSS